MQTKNSFLKLILFSKFQYDYSEHVYVFYKS